MTLANSTTIDAAAQRLIHAGATGVPCAPVRDLIGETDVTAAYAVQAAVTNTWLASGRRVVGRKIGLTSPAVQRQLGVDQPDFGLLFADMDVSHGMQASMKGLMQPKCEAEVAFVLKGDLDQPQLATADVMAAIDYAVPALEIVASRISKWDIRITDTIADNASSGMFVLGHNLRRLQDFDVVGCGMLMRRNGEIVSTGLGAACLGSPINALLWLARTMADTAYPLRAGDVVLSGALGPMVQVEAEDVFEAEIEGLGIVRVCFSEADER